MGYPKRMLFRKSAQPEVDLNPRSNRRHQRADAARRHALSPMRIFFMVLILPLTIGLMAASIFLRISEYEKDEALIHLIALAGCKATQAVGAGPFRKGQPGYHARYDIDNDGVSCETIGPSHATYTLPQQGGSEPIRSVGNAKFVRP